MIEDYNAQITNKAPVNIIRSETIRGGVNLELLERFRQHIRVNGYPEPIEYQKQKDKIKLQPTVRP